MYDEVLSGRTTLERKLAVCSGSAPVTPAERAELLTVLAGDADERIRERASNRLLSQPVGDFVTALQGEAPSPRLFRYCAQNLITTPEIAAAMAKHWRCPPEFLTAAAKNLPSAAVQEMMSDLDRLSASPALVAAMAHAAALLPDQRQQIEELLRETPEGEAVFAEAAVEAEPDIVRRVTLIQRLSKMRVTERVQLALKGNREERIALIRDPCKVVQRAVLQSARITDREVETFSSMASLTDDVLRLIAMNRNFRRNYIVVRNLINNPKTPIDVSLHLLPAITPMDLRALALNKNIPDTLRNSANRLQRQRSEKRD